MEAEVAVARYTNTATGIVHIVISCSAVTLNTHPPTLSVSSRKNVLDDEWKSIENPIFSETKLKLASLQRAMTVDWFYSQDVSYTY